MAKLEIDDYVLEHLLHKCYDSEGNHFYWREVTDNEGGEGEGYLVIWPDGEYHHTYRFPPDLVG